MRQTEQLTEWAEEVPYLLLLKNCMAQMLHKCYSMKLKKL